MMILQFLMIIASLSPGYEVEQFDEILSLALILVSHVLAFSSVSLLFVLVGSRMVLAWFSLLLVLHHPPPLFGIPDSFIVQCIVLADLLVTKFDQPFRSIPCFQQNRRTNNHYKSQ